MGELTFFLGLQVKKKEDGIFISQDKYDGEILNKFGFSSIRTSSTPMETNMALTKDKDGEDVDVHLYRSMIGSLMYLTSSRPDIMFTVYACLRFQVQPKVSHLNAVKRIFRNLKGQPKLGLCVKKQTVVANSTTEAEYIAASHCCGQVLWIQNQMLDYGYNFMQTKIHVDNESVICVIKNPAYHSKTKHIEIRHHFIRDSYRKRLIEMVKIHTDHNVADLLTKAFDVSRLIFWWQALVCLICSYIGKRGRDTKIPSSGGPPIKVGNEAVHKELGDRMEMAATTASSLEPEQNSDAQTRFGTTSKLSNDPPLSKVNTFGSGEDNIFPQDKIKFHSVGQITTLSEGFHQIIDFLNASRIQYALTENPTKYVSFIKQFWRTASVGTSANGEVELTTTIDGQVKTINEASLRRHLKLEDNGSVTTLPNLEIFEQLVLIGYVTDSDKFTFQKGHFSPQWKFLIHTILHCLSPKKTAWEQFSSNIATAIIYLATNRTYNFSKLIFDAMIKNLENPHKFLMYPRFIQICLNKQKRLLQRHTQTYPTLILTQKVFSNMKRVSSGYSGIDFALFPTMISAPETSPSRITSSPSLSPQHTPVSTPSTSQLPNTQPTPDAEEAVPMPHESSLHIHSLRCDEGSLSLNELTDLCTSLSKKVEGLESELKQTKHTYSTARTKLILRVKKLEKIVKASKSRRRVRVVESDDEEDLVDPSKQGRSLIEELDMDAGISLVPPHAINEGRNDDTQIYDLLAEQLGVFSTATTLADAAKRRRSVETAQTYTKRRTSVSTASRRVSTASRTVSTADVSTASELGSTAGVKAKDKGKAIMQESEPLKKQIDWSDPAVLRYHAQLNRPYSVAEVRKNMVMYLKNQGGYKMNYFKRMKYDDIRPIFESVWDQIQSFAPMDSEKEKDSENKGSRKKSLARKRAGENQSEESIKRQKIEDDVEKEELKVYLDLVQREEFAMEIESLATKSSKNYKIFSEMLDDFDRQDVLDLHRLVKARYMTSSPEGYDLMLWGDLKILFEPDEEDKV
ncbi:hypothetical protein Tco_0456213 [Tanacetum coccineum]